MNQKTHTSASGAAIGFIAASVIFAVLVVAVKLLVNVPAIDADRGAVISKALFEMRTNEVASLNNIGWADQPRSIVRLPIETAIQMTERNWQNPAAARADLIARAENAAKPAPKVAPKPNPAE
ncbi:MAG TPA: hypothetical protein VHX90_02845 [Verrucomicrobiae bacterium]|nr:hypothetical protein [Verrucomicrobiae bacterium]